MTMKTVDADFLAFLQEVSDKVGAGQRREKEDRFWQIEVNVLLLFEVVYRQGRGEKALDQPRKPASGGRWAVGGGQCRGEGTWRGRKLGCSGKRADSDGRHHGAPNLREVLQVPLPGCRAGLAGFTGRFAGLKDTEQTGCRASCLLVLPLLRCRRNGPMGRGHPVTEEP